MLEEQESLDMNIENTVWTLSFFPKRVCNLDATADKKPQAAA